MKKTCILWVCILLLGVTAAFAGQEEPEQQIAIKEGEPFTYAVMEFGGSFDNMEKSIGTFMGEFFKQGLTPAGPMTGVYYNDPRVVKPEELKWEVGFVVAKDTKAQPPLKIGEFNCKTAAYYLYIGPYEKMNPAYEKIFKHVDDNGYKVVWPVYDQYLNNPMEAKPEDLRTQIIIPLEKK